MKKYIIITALVLVTLLTGVGFWYAGTLPVSVETVVIASDIVDDYVVADGLIRPTEYQSRVSPVSGVIEEVRFEEYTTVSKDEVVLKIRTQVGPDEVVVDVSAPIAGMYVFPTNPQTGMKMAYKKGDVVVQGSQLFTVYNNSTLVFEAVVNEVDLADLGINNKTEVTLESYPEEKLLAELSRIYPEGIMSQLGETRVKVRINFVDSLPERAYINLSGTARITIEERYALTVPLDALVTEDGEDVVYIVRDDEADLRPVSTGDIFGSNIEIVAGLSEGDEVIIDPSDKIKDKTAVTVEE